ncbi:MAG: carbonic anhydrase [Actinomycetota bacterium]|nr:carbonic anhydrase [Actinomycetota bacterium]
MIGKSVVTDFTPEVKSPVLGENAYVHPIGAAIGDVHLGKRVLVTGIVRADEGQAIIIGDDSNVQDGCIVHGLETLSHGKPTANRVTAPDGTECSVYIGERTSMAHQSQVHGPSKVGNDSFIAMQVLVFKGEVGNNCVVEPGAKVLGGVKIPDGRYVPAGSIIAKQADADALPMITDDYPLKNLNKGVVHVNTSLAVGYNKEQPL